MLATTARPGLNKPRIPPRSPMWPSCQPHRPEPTPTAAEAEAAGRPLAEAFITPAAFKLPVREPLAFLLIAGRIVGLSP